MIELIRFQMDERGTFGALVMPGHGSLVTVEREWLEYDEQGHHWPYGVDNRSCVPAGIYDLSFEHSNKYGKRMWHLIGEGVTYMPTPGAPPEWRSNCMFHAANKAHEVEGCPAPGLIFDPNAPQVLKSQTALGILSLAISELKDRRLRIRNAW